MFGEVELNVEDGVYCGRGGMTRGTGDGGEEGAGEGLVWSTYSQRWFQDIRGEADEQYSCSLIIAPSHGRVFDPVQPGRRNARLQPFDQI